MTEKMPPVQTIWMRYTTNEGKSHVMEHQVWDRDLFVRARYDEAAAEARKVKDGRARVEQITADDYRRER